MTGAIVRRVGILATGGLLMALGCAELGLEARMRASLDAGKAAVIARDGQIVAELEGRGVKPLLDALDRDPHAFECAVAMDKVVGRAAAAFYVIGGAAKVIAPVMSEGAVKLLEKHGIEAVAEKTVPYIINRKGDGMCPMDRATMHLENPVAIVEEVRNQLRRMSKAEDPHPTR